MGILGLRICTLILSAVFLFTGPVAFGQAGEENPFPPGLQPSTGSESTPLSDVTLESSEEAVRLLQASTLFIGGKPTPISLPEALETASRKNLSLRIEQTEYRQERWRFYNQLSTFLPNVSFFYEQRRTDGTFFVADAVPVTVDITLHNIGFNLDAQVFNGFRNTLQSVSQFQAARAAKADLLQTQENILLRTYELYQDLLLSKANIAIEETSLEEAESTLAINQARYNAGAATRVDVLQAEAQVASFRQRLQAAQGNFRIQSAALAETIGIPVLTDLIPVEATVTPAPLLPLTAPLPSLVAEAMENRQAIQRDRFAMRANRANQWSSLSDLLPDVYLRARTQAQGATLNRMLNSQIAEFVAVWPLENLGVNAMTQFKALQAQTDRARLVLEQTERSITEGVAQNFYQSESQRAQIDSARQRMLSEREAVRLAKLRLEEGLITTTDFLTNQVALNQARLNLAQAILNYNVSQARLLHGIGRMTVQAILTPATAWGPQSLPHTPQQPNP